MHNVMIDRGSGTRVYEPLINTGEPIRYAALSTASRNAWLKITAAVAKGL